MSEERIQEQQEQQGQQEQTQPEKPKRGQRKVRIGRVVSNKMNKTIVVAIERKVMHPLKGLCEDDEGHGTR
jgi:hypothetical protein